LSLPDPITDKDKAHFLLEQNILQLDETISRTTAKIQRLQQDITSMLRLGSKRNALTLLSQKKKLEAFWERLSGQKYQLED
jgi:hypothetical protein